MRTLGDELTAYLGRREVGDQWKTLVDSPALTGATNLNLSVHAGHEGLAQTRLRHSPMTRRARRKHARNSPGRPEPEARSARRSQNPDGCAGRACPSKVVARSVTSAR
jgi:hypothetical protein